jgi:hypothetical protein
VSFAQSRIGDNFVTRHGRNHLGGAERTAKIAAVERAEALMSEPSSQSFCLGDSPISERTIEMALPNTCNIPLGLTVANNDELSSFHALTRLP